jgi:hypothetical protein
VKPSHKHKKTHEQTIILDLARDLEGSHAYALHLRLETWESLPLSLSLVTPTTSTLVQDNTELSSLTGHRAFFGPNQYKSSVFFLHTIRTPDA